MDKEVEVIRDKGGEVGGSGGVEGESRGRKKKWTLINKWKRGETHTGQLRRSSNNVHEEEQAASALMPNTPSDERTAGRSSSTLISQHQHNTSLGTQESEVQNPPQLSALCYNSKKVFHFHFCTANYPTWLKVTSPLGM